MSVARYYGPNRRRQLINYIVPAAGGIIARDQLQRGSRAVAQYIVQQAREGARAAYSGVKRVAREQLSGYTKKSTRGTKVVRKGGYQKTMVGKSKRKPRKYFKRKRGRSKSKITRMPRSVARSIKSINNRLNRVHEKAMWGPVQQNHDFNSGAISGSVNGKAYGNFLLRTKSTMDALVAEGRNMYNPTSDALTVETMPNGLKVIKVVKNYVVFTFRNNTSNDLYFWLYYCKPSKKGTDVSFSSALATAFDTLQQPSASTLEGSWWSSPMHASNAISEYWKVYPKVQKHLLQPGQEITLKYNLPTGVYNANTSGQSAYLQRFTRNFHIMARGALIHDETNVTNVNIGDCQLDYIEHSYVSYKWKKALDVQHLDTPNNEALGSITTGVQRQEESAAEEKYSE